MGCCALPVGRRSYPTRRNKKGLRTNVRSPFQYGFKRAPGASTSVRYAPTAMPAPMCLITASPNSEHLRRVAPSMRRSKS